jgi:hypothetical protein
MILICLILAWEGRDSIKNVRYCQLSKKIWTRSWIYKPKVEGFEFYGTLLGSLLVLTRNIFSCLYEASNIS